MRLNKIGAILVACTIVITILFAIYGRSIWVPIKHKIMGRQTVADIQMQIGAKNLFNLQHIFKAKQQEYPPKSITLLAIKDEAKLELWDSSNQNNIHIKTYKINALSGISGPKLREGDKQVPEGLYKISGLNPNSSYHLSMKINYPNAFDLAQSKQENRTNLGGDIFIHGKALSIGCLAMGDEAIEELFILAADIGITNIDIVIAPRDPRKTSLNTTGRAEWIEKLYQNIETEFNKFK